MEQKSVASLDRALAIMNSFREGEPTTSLSEIAERAGLHKSTALRLIETLEQHGYVRRVGLLGYRLGSKVLRLASIYQQSVQPLDVIRPTLQELVTATQESASFNVARDTYRVCVFRIDSPQRIRDHVRPGDILPIEKGAAGHILSAFGRNAGTELGGARRRMVARSLGELDKDTAGVASPVFDRDGLAGALAISGPRTRFDKPAMARMERLLLVASIHLTQELGGEDTGLAAALAGLTA